MYRSKDQTADTFFALLQAANDANESLAERKMPEVTVRTLPFYATLHTEKPNTHPDHCGDKYRVSEELYKQLDDPTRNSWICKNSQEAFDSILRAWHRRRRQISSKPAAEKSREVGFIDRCKGFLAEISILQQTRPQCEWVDCGSPDGILRAENEYASGALETVLQDRIVKPELRQYVAEMLGCGELTDPSARDTNHEQLLKAEDATSHDVMS